MDELLTPVSTTYLKPKKTNDDGFLLAEVSNSSEANKLSKPAQISSPDDVIEALKSQPDYDTLVKVLRFLTAGTSSFQLQAPGPKSAAIVHLLVTEITPNYWALLSEDSTDPDAGLLIQCLSSVTGINAVLTHIKALIHESKTGGEGSGRPDLTLNLGIFLDLLAAILSPELAIQKLWAASISKLADASMRKVQAQSLVTLMTGGRLLSLVAEAHSIAPRRGVQDRAAWLGDGVLFSKWIGRNVSSWAKLGPEDSELHICSELVQRGMSLGYSESLTEEIFNGLLLCKDPHSAIFTRICFRQVTATRKMLQLLLHYLSRRFLNSSAGPASGQDSTISAVAGVINAVVADQETRKDELISWCTASSGAGLGDGLGIRRAVLAALAKDKDAIATVLEKSLNQFGDELYIKHAAMLQQQVHTEVLLLSAGYVHRLSPIKLVMLLRSGQYMRTISNRIAATQTKSRVLGMVVGETLSSLSDGKGKQLDFKMEETDEEEAQILKQLVNVSDVVGPVDPILSSEPQHRPLKTQSPALAVAKKSTKKSRPQISQPKPKAVIEEIDSSAEDDEDDDLVPYNKHSDPEDSDDDADLVQRNKLKPPVYIRDLITFLRDSENYDKQKLALQTAPVLIRRKANYGTEVSSHALEIARLLVGMQDKFEIDDFNELRQQGMMALVVAVPKVMGPWFARTFFEGDYSLSQRMAVLVTIGLSARQLAGFEISEYEAAAAFPSKRLPQKMEQLYLESVDQGERVPPSQLRALPSTAIDNIAQSLTASFLEPLAAEAADATTGPDVLKLQTFTARYKSKTKSKPRIRSIPNTTASLLATSFFSPLTALFQVALRSSKPIVLNPSLLSAYLQTLGIIIHAAGPSTLSLPQLTSELWDLLLGTRTHVLGDLGSMRGWLVAMAALLEVNEGDMRRLCEQQGREVVETREWVGGVFERTRGGDGGEENDVKMLAAGVLIKLGEAIEKYQAMLMGSMIGFS